MKEFFDRMTEYFKANPVFFYILVAAAALLIILIIVLITVSIYRAKHKKTVITIPAEDEAIIIENDKASEMEAISAVPNDEPPLAPPSDSLLNAEKSTVPGDSETRPNELKEKFSPVVTYSTSDNQLQKNESTADSNNHKISPSIAKQETYSANKDNSISENETEDVRRTYAAKQERVLRKNKQDEEEKKNAYSGKWLIQKNEDATYYFELRASNGEKLLTSINYTSVNGAKNGIKTHKNNIQKNNIVISQNKKGQFFFKLLNGSKQLLCTGETYPTKTGCENAVESVKRFAETAIVNVAKDDEDE